MVNTINSKNFQMNYFKFGNGNKNMIIIPGISLFNIMNFEEDIKKAYSMFENDYSVYCFDRIKNMKSNYSIDDMTDDLILAIESLNLIDLYIFGASQGGMIGLNMAIKKPNLIKKLVICSTIIKTSDDSLNKFNHILSINKKKDLLDYFFKAIYTNDLYNSLKNNIDIMAKSITDYDFNRFRITTEAILNLDLSKNIDKIKCPILNIYSKNDQLFNIDDLNYINNFIKIDNHIYDLYGHAVYDEAAGIKEIIYNFYK